MGRFNFAVATLGLLLTSVAATAAAREPVDLILVLATDVSNSIDAEEYGRQKHGINDALLDPKVARAISICAPNGIALAYTEWSGTTEYQTVVGFKKIIGPSTMTSFARRVIGAPRSYRGDTDLDSALRGSLALIRSAPFEAKRRAIDVSTDGIQTVNNLGGAEVPFVPLQQFHEQLGRTRDEVVAAGVTIKSLAIETDEEDQKPSPNGGFSYLDQYLDRYVTGGPKSFTQVVRNIEQMHAAFRAKLVREICDDKLTQLR